VSLRGPINNRAEGPGVQKFQIFPIDPVVRSGKYGGRETDGIPKTLIGRKGLGYGTEFADGKRIRQGLSVGKGEFSGPVLEKIKNKRPGLWDFAERFPKFPPCRRYFRARG